jgi:hypothetical protein
MATKKRRTLAQAYALNGFTTNLARLTGAAVSEIFLLEITGITIRPKEVSQAAATRFQGIM